MDTLRYAFNFPFVAEQASYEKNKRRCQPLAAQGSGRFTSHLRPSSCESAGCQKAVL